MKLRYHPYQLKFSHNFSTLGQNSFREGILFEVTFEDGLVGYCDCHPWVELGDLPLTEQLRAAKDPELTSLLKASFRFARIDAKARRDQRSVFEGMEIPLSHQLISIDQSLDRCIQEGITYFKIKAGADPERELAILQEWIETHPQIKLRLDFNERFSRAEFMDYWRALSTPIRKCIDYAEDPYRYNETQWEEDQKHLGANFAADHRSGAAIRHPLSARYIIHKPAVEEPIHLTAKQIRIVVTTYMDHPFGQMCAAYAAAKLKLMHPKQIDYCGLLTHKCYEETPFTAAIHTKGPQLLPTSGTGFGFNALLQELPWQNL
jgi:O-succinylbenzoate synthase